ncbi:MAG: hypothetical protein KBA30_02065 [Clostridia bacterium]|nr:hypothetical protein [Clostridia bacterium]
MIRKGTNIRRWAETAQADIPELWPAIRTAVEMGSVSADHPDLENALGNLHVKSTPIRRLVPVFNVLLVLFLGCALYLAYVGQFSFRGAGGWFEKPRIVQIASGDYHIAALDSKGRVHCTGNLVFRERVGQEEWWSDWTGLTAIDADGRITIGLKRDGTVVYNAPASSGLYENGSTTPTPYLPLDLSSWTDIVQVSAGQYELFGLRADGTVLMTEVLDTIFLPIIDEAVVGALTDISQVSAGDAHAAFLREDGTVVIVGSSQQEEVAGKVAQWSGIRAISAGSGYTMGLKQDGTVVWAGRGYRGWLNEIWEWKDIIAISAGGEFAAGLRSDGTVVVTGNDSVKQAVSSWTDVVAISNGEFWLAALQSDGTVLTTGADFSAPTVED